MAETDREVLQDMYVKGVYIRGKNRGGVECEGIGIP